MLLDVILIVVKILVVVTVVMLSVAYATYAERKVIGAMQVRMGPSHVGFKGLLQPFADAVKLIAKEDFNPNMVDKPVYILAPIIGFIPALLSFAVIPFSDTIPLESSFLFFEEGTVLQPFIANVDISLMYVLALSSVGTYGIIMAGWASNSKYALLGSLRASAQVISYETAMGLSLVTPVLLAGSTNLYDITQAQAGMWYFIPQFVAFIIYAISAVAETNRAPFDLPEAETEVVAGFHVEYSSMKFALFFLAEYANMYVVSAICAICFLGGFNGPLLPGFVWFVIKVCAFMFFFLWLRATLPRLRFDQLMGLGWKILIPIALANIMLTSVIVYMVR